VTIAAGDPPLAARLCRSLASRHFRPYAGADMVGVEVAGALKNVIAIACGAVEGRGLGENARAALITRGLVEVARLVAALGGQPQTCMGLAGVGDLTLSCTTPQSRNYAFGLALGRGACAADPFAGGTTVEGVQTARALPALAARLGVEMPIADAVHDVVWEGVPLDRVMAELLVRPLRAEVG